MKNPLNFFLKIGVIIPAFLLVACGEEKKEAANPAETMQEPSEQFSENSAQSNNNMITIPEGPGNLEKGQEIYEICLACHGEQGEGNRDMEAPALVNMAPWSIKLQLVKFKSGLRGCHDQDDYGAQMADMAETLETDQDILDVAAYIDNLPDRKTKLTVVGNAQNGARFYDMICGACHGPGGEGMASVEAPTLVGVDDWYLERQYRHFQKKMRGYKKADKRGRQMGMMSTSLPDDQTFRDILVFLHERQKEKAE